MVKVFACFRHEEQKASHFEMQIGRPTWQLSRWICYVQRVTSLGSRLVCQRAQIFEADFDISQDPFKDILWILIFWSYSNHTVSTSSFWCVSNCITVGWLHNKMRERWSMHDKLIKICTGCKYYWDIEMVFRCFASSGLFSTPLQNSDGMTEWHFYNPVLCGFTKEKNGQRKKSWS